MMILSEIGFIVCLAAVKHNPILFGVLAFICLIGMFAFEGNTKVGDAE